MSRLSPYLHCGQISPRLMQERVEAAGGKKVRYPLLIACVQAAEEMRLHAASFLWPVIILKLCHR